MTVMTLDADDPRPSHEGVTAWYFVVWLMPETVTEKVPLPFVVVSANCCVGWPDGLVDRNRPTGQFDSPQVLYFTVPVSVNDRPLLMDAGPLSVTAGFVCGGYRQLRASVSVAALGGVACFGADAPTAETALLFGISVGSNHLGRPPGSDVIAYNGRVYGRATKKEVFGKSAHGGYKVVRNIDGAKRMIIAGLLGLPSEFALYDIIMEHFGPDTVPR